MLGIELPARLEPDRLRELENHLRSAGYLYLAHPTQRRWIPATEHDPEAIRLDADLIGASTFELAPETSSQETPLETILRKFGPPQETPMSAPSTTATPAAFEPDAVPRIRPYAEILQILRRPIPESVLKSKVKGGTTIHFLPWYRAARILDKYLIWEKELTQTTQIGPDAVVVVRVEILCDLGDGRIEWVHRDATGRCPVDQAGYGDACSNAESMAFRRACANWGLARHLYEKESGGNSSRHGGLARHGREISAKTASDSSG